MDRFESLIEQQIRRAQERGEFDDLPGSGKPLPDRGELTDELWWVKDYLRREGLSTEALLPQSLQLARQVERLPQTVRGLRSEAAVRSVVSDLNEQIIAYLRAPVGPLVPLRTVDPDATVAQWRAAQPPPATPAESPVPARPKRRWWPRREAPPSEK
jgi:DnaJ homologue, subfamily C, member 28, conserved domain